MSTVFTVEPAVSTTLKKWAPKEQRESDCEKPLLEKGECLGAKMKNEVGGATT